jgi:hypothetical protein
MRQLTLVTTAGKVIIEVPYCQCRETGQWFSPFHDLCGLERRQTATPELERRLCLTATATFSYEHAARVCAIWGSPIIDDSTIHRHVQQAGQRARERERELVRQSRIPFHKERIIREAAKQLAGETCAPFSLIIMADGWMVRERGRHWGLKPRNAEGERVKWQEQKTAIIMRSDQLAATQSGRGMILGKTVVSHKGDWEEFADKLYARALQCGLMEAREVFFVADGALWLWKMKGQKFQSATGVLDFYHAMEHLYACGRALLGEANKEAVEDFVEPLRHQLKHGGEMGFLRSLEDLKETLGDLEEERREAVVRECNYFQRQAENLHYKEVSERGSPIGSGSMESTCAQLQGRFKRTGQFWSNEGRENLLSLVLAEANRDEHELWFYRRELE